MTDLRSLLELASDGPRRPVDVGVVVSRGRDLRVQRRLGRSLTGVLVLALGAIGTLDVGTVSTGQVDVADDRTSERRVDLEVEGSEPSPTSSATPPPTSRPLAATGGDGPVHARGTSPPSAAPAPAVAGSSPATTPWTAPSNARTPAVFATNRDGNWEIYAEREGGSGIDRITHDSAYDYAPSWSPDRTHIVFARRVGDNSDVYVVRRDGSGLRRLTESPGVDEDPEWSPDGKWIAFVSDRRGAADRGTSYDGEMIEWKTGEVWVMRADGSDARVVSATPRLSAGSPSWTPDSRRIVYHADDSDAVTAEIRIADATGDNESRLLNDGGFNFDPNVSPDGSTIVYRAVKNGTSQLRVMDVDGTDVRVLISDAAYAYLPTWTADASAVVFTRDIDGARYRYDDRTTTPIECAAIRENDPRNPADLCPMGPAPSELWTVRIDGSGLQVRHGDGFDAADADV